MKYKSLIFTGFLSCFFYESVYTMFRPSWMNQKSVPVKSESSGYTDSSSSDYIKPQLTSSVVAAAQYRPYASIVAEALAKPISSSEVVEKQSRATDNGSSGSTPIPSNNSFLYNKIFGNMKFVSLDSATARVADISKLGDKQSPIVDEQLNRSQQGFQLEQVAPDNIAQRLSSEKLASSQDVNKISTIDDNLQQQRPPSNPLLDAIKNKPKLKSKAVLDSNVVDNSVVQSKTNNYTQQQYFVERTKVQDDAEQNVLKSINQDVVNQLQQQWPNILTEYTAKRQGVNVPQSRIDALKIKMQDQMLKDAVVKNKAAIDTAVAQALKEFESTAVVVKPKMVGTKNVNIVQSNQENIRIQAEGAMKKSIERKIDESFAQQESIMKEDYGLDHPNASQPEIIVAINKEIAPLKNQAYLDAFVKNKIAIKQAGQDAVAAWQIKQQAQVAKSSKFKNRTSSPVSVINIP